MKRCFHAVAALLLVLGCAPAPVKREARLVPVDPALLLERLEASNRGPSSLRFQGRLRASGQGSADFGGRVVEGVGLRLDAVAGPFGTAVASVACRAGSRCDIYVPSKRALYSGSWNDWGAWLEALLLGRVPVTGRAVRAWRGEDGRLLLVLEGGPGWRQEVEFGGESGQVGRVVWSRWGVPRMEAFYEARGEVGAPGFPGRIEVRLADPPADYELRFRRVERGAVLEEGLLVLPVPPDAVVIPLDGPNAQHSVPLPFSVPLPGGGASVIPLQRAAGGENSPPSGR